MPAQHARPHWQLVQTPSTLELGVASQLQVSETATHEGLRSPCVVGDGGSDGSGGQRTAWLPPASPCAPFPSLIASVLSPDCIFWASGSGQRPGSDRQKGACEGHAPPSTSPGPPSGSPIHREGLPGAKYRLPVASRTPIRPGGLKAAPPSTHSCCTPSAPTAPKTLVAALTSLLMLGGSSRRQATATCLVLLAAAAAGVPAAAEQPGGPTYYIAADQVRRRGRRSCWRWLCTRPGHPPGAACMGRRRRTQRMLPACPPARPPASPPLCPAQISWDYAPSGVNLCSGEEFNSRFLECLNMGALCAVGAALSPWCTAHVLRRTWPG